MTEGRGRKRKLTPSYGNGSMHVRNRYYRNAPDFRQLIQDDVDLKNVVKKWSHGSSDKIDFKNAEVMRALTAALLKRDFGIKYWTIPLNRLCPPIPNRLNYIHWVEDLVAIPWISTSETYTTQHPVQGIDIGTGASCIYPILGTQINGWSFIATDIDQESISCAQKIVTENALEKKISLLHVSLNAMLLEPFEKLGLDHLDFSMCNPPFFEFPEECDPNPRSTGVRSSNEGFTNGGEVIFIQRMIDDSMIIRERIRWYTSMVGRKSSIRHVLRILRERGITNTRTIEFLQGRTVRWGVAWSFTSAGAGSIKAKDKVLSKRKEAKRKDSYLFVCPPSLAGLPADISLFEEVKKRIISLIRSMDMMKCQSKTTESARFMLKITKEAPSPNPSNNALSEFETHVEIFEASNEENAGEFSDAPVHVSVSWQNGMSRSSFWTFVDQLESHTLRSSRAWRRRHPHLAK